jgi:alkylresorcinol/alkylpyrone synthase
VKVIGADLGGTDNTTSPTLALEESDMGSSTDRRDPGATVARTGEVPVGSEPSLWNRPPEAIGQVDLRPARKTARRPRDPRRAGSRIVGLASANSETTFTQEQVLEHLGLRGDEFAERIFARSGVRRRHLNLSEDFLADTLQGRTARVEDELMQYAIAAVDRLGVDPREIGTVVSASLYSLGCPTLAHRLIDHYGMDPSTDKYHITGVGCASAVPLLRLASQMLPLHPGKHSLVVAAESMSSTLMRATDQDPRAKTVGSAIFGDGCAAALLSAGQDTHGPLILASQVHQIGGTLGAVSLSLSPADSHLHLARELPDLAAAGLSELVTDFLRRNRLERSEIDHWLVHPGGRRIIECVQDVLELSREDVAVSWEALAEHGNIGTPSILYVLESTIATREPRAGERGLMVTIGPGVSVGLMLLQF